MCFQKKFPRHIVKQVDALQLLVRAARPQPDVCTCAALSDMLDMIIAHPEIAAIALLEADGAITPRPDEVTQ